MTIHHATQTKATGRSIKLTEVVNGVEAEWTDHEDNVHVKEDFKAKNALAAMINFQDEMQAGADDEDTLDAVSVAIFGEEEKTSGGTVVKPHYKENYMTNGTKGRGNGDSLYDWLLTKVGTGEHLDLDTLENIATNNSIDHSKYSRTSHGWAGRLRMTIGNMLRNRLFTNGFIFDETGAEDKVNAKWVKATIKARDAKKAAREEAKLAKSK